MGTMDCLAMTADLLTMPETDDPAVVAQAFVLPIDEQRRANVEAALKTFGADCMQIVCEGLVDLYCSGAADVQPRAAASLFEIGLPSLHSILKTFSENESVDVRLTLVELLRSIGLRYCTEHSSEEVKACLRSVVVACMTMARDAKVLAALTFAGRDIRENSEPMAA